MKKKLIFASMTLLAMTGLVSCGGTSGNNRVPSGPSIEGDSIRTTKDSLHKGVDSITYTDKVFASNSISDYKIVYDANKDGALDAANSISSNIYNAVGAKLEVTTSATYSSNAKLIVLGNEDILEEAGMSYKDDVTDIYTYKMDTIGNSILVYSRGFQGFQFAHIRLLRALVGFDAMSARRTVYVLDGKELKAGDAIYLPDCHIVERPDYYLGRYAPNSSDNVQRYEMGFTTEEPIIMTKWNGEKHFVHNSFDYLPPSVYKADHPSYYSTGSNAGSQLCYTAHGNETDLNDMLSIVTNTMFEYIKANPTKPIITITQEDSETGCECDSCEKVYAKYAEPGKKTPFSATILKFLKKLEKRVEAKINDYNKSASAEDKLTMPWICVFAYHLTETPPINVDDDVDLRGTNAGVIMAPIYGNFNHSYYDNVYKTKDGITNKEYMSRFDGWANCIDHVMSWTYEISYYNYTIPFNSFQAQVLNNRYMYNLGARCLYPEGQTYNWEGVFFHRLKDYLDARSTFEVTVNQTELIDNWFRYYYKEAGVYLRQLYNDVIDNLTYIEENLNAVTNFNFVMYNNVKQKSCWTLAQMKRYAAWLDSAFKAIEKYKTSNPSLYADIYYYIECECVFPYYFITTLFDDELSSEERTYYRDRFVQYCHDTTIKYETHEAARKTGVTFDSSLFASWGY